jgi:hypothetical protein
MLCFVEGQDGTNGAHLGSRSEGEWGKDFVLLER